MKNVFVSLAMLFASCTVMADSGAVAGAASGSNADSAAVSGSAAGANSSNALTINQAPSVQPSDITTRQTGTSTVKTAPSITITGPASGPCTGLSGGFGVSFLGGAVGGNLATVDRGCQLRESSRIMAMILPTLAPEDAAEVRAMLMDSLRALYGAAIDAKEPKK